MFTVHILSTRFRKNWHFSKTFRNFFDLYDWLLIPKQSIYFYNSTGTKTYRYYRILSESDKNVIYLKVYDNSPKPNVIEYVELSDIIAEFPFVKDFKNNEKLTVIYS